MLVLDSVDVLENLEAVGIDRGLVLLVQPVPEHVAAVAGGVERPL